MRRIAGIISLFSVLEAFGLLITIGFSAQATDSTSSGNFIKHTANVTTYNGKNVGTNTVKRPVSNNSNTLLDRNLGTSEENTNNRNFIKHTANVTTYKGKKMGTITVTDPISKKSITLLDRNLGATEAGVGENSYGEYFQWGNNYGFSSTDQSTKDLVEYKGYGPGNEYENNKFIFTDGGSLWIDENENRKITVNQKMFTNLWGGSNGNNTLMTINSKVSKQGPCPNGFHVPTASEWENLGKYRRNANSGNTKTLNDQKEGYYRFLNFYINDKNKITKFRNDLKIPFGGGVRNQAMSRNSDGSINFQLGVNGTGRLAYLRSSNADKNGWTDQPITYASFDERFYINDQGRWNYGLPIRCFSNNNLENIGAGYLVIFDTKGGSPIESKIVTSTESILNSYEDIPIKAGYVFEGWYTSDGNLFNLYSNINSLKNNNSNLLNGNKLTLYAKRTNSDINYSTESNGEETITINDNGSSITILAKNLGASQKGLGDNSIGKKYNRGNWKEYDQGNCPNGYHIPGDEERNNLYTSFKNRYDKHGASRQRITNYNEVIAKSFKNIFFLATSYNQNPPTGSYWSSTTNKYHVSIQSNSKFYSDSVNFKETKGNGSYLIRCFKDGKYKPGTNSGSNETFSGRDTNSGATTNTGVSTGGVISAYTGIINPPTRDGYIFKGWYTDNNYMNPYNPNTTITGGLTLYSKWEKIDIEPERSGNNTINKIEYTINHYIENLSGGYTLQASEKSNASAGSKVTPDRKTYEGFSTPSAQTVTITTGATITYKYSRNKYKVTIEKGEGISQVQGAGSYKYGGTVKLSATPLSGYKFTGFEGDVKTTTFAMPAKDISVKATAEKNTTIYTIKYDLNGGKLAKGKNNPSSFTPSSASFSLNPPTKSGYIFAGWIETIDGKTIGTKTYVFIPKGSIGNRTYKATWLEQRNVKGVIENQLENLQGNFITAEILPITKVSSDKLTTIKKTPYEGFITPPDTAKKSSSNEGGAIGEVLELGDGIATLIYKYKRASYSLKIIKDEGIESVEGEGVHKYQEPISLKVKLKPGYTFDKFEGEINVAEFEMPAKNITITAKSKKE